MTKHSNGLRRWSCALPFGDTLSPAVSFTGILRLFFIVLGMVITLLILLPFHIAALVCARFGLARPAGFAPFAFHRMVLYLTGTRMVLTRPLPGDRPLLLVANHLSWFDIVVLGAVAPLSFVAKAEMKSWPVFGWLAKLQRTIFIVRERRRQSGKQANAMAERMLKKEIIVLFPEGTTTDGNLLDPFKTPLFEAARFALVASPVQKAVVQPVAIHYTHLHGMPIGRAERPHIAWPGDIGLGESLLPVFMKGGLDVTIHVGEPIAFTEDANRKAVSAKAVTSIRSMLYRGARSTHS